MEIRSEPDGRDEEQDGKDDHQAVEHEDTGEERGEQQSWKKTYRKYLDLAESLKLFKLEWGFFPTLFRINCPLA